MNIIIPMAGEGKRFAEQGYTTSKPAIPTTDRRTGQDKPMVVCAVLDLPGVEPDGANVLFIDRDFHKRDGVEDAIHGAFPNARFIAADHLTEGQACTCLLAKEQINTEEELLIALYELYLIKPEIRSAAYHRFTEQYPDMYGVIRIASGKVVPPELIESF